ncbi:MAG: heavy-metal-associated domain-containing protein [Bacteroidales bacterium]|jgi:copper chaperone CopZ|nr:cation transporter [Bacteroidales bacterium]MCK9499208.1 cation transporter [Bacteroidales bacterium]MDY0314663.1 heavy-metal-associated domain-containing protein [Bacteroidales bacterium]NLB85593.1 heavy-metal-associated domain-containing protein [Bacteroidales bacterium]
MKKSILILTMMFLTVAVINAQDKNTKKVEKENSKISEVVLNCEMDCGNCAAKVKKQLSYTKGVTAVDVNHETDLVVVKYRNDKTDVDKLIASLNEIDYKANVHKPANTQKLGCEKIGIVKPADCGGAKAESSASGCGGCKSKSHTNCQEKELEKK